MATLLTIIQDACDELGISRPSAVIANTDTGIRQLVAMSNRSGRQLVREGDWTVLQRLHTFTTVDSQAEYSLPSDYDRLIRETEWDRAEKRPLIGPTNPQEWQAIKSGQFGQGVIDRRFRIYRSASSSTRVIYIDPTPDSTNDNETLAFEYISNGWCESSGGTAQTEWAADTDVNVVPEDLLILDLIVRWRRSKGLDFASEADEYVQLLDTYLGQDRPSPILNLSRRKRIRLLGAENVPDTGYP